MDFFVVEAAGGLVEQQDLRLGGQRAGQLDALLGAERQAGNDVMRDVLEVEIRKDLVDLGVERGFAAPDPGQLSESLTMSLVVREWVPTRTLSSTERLGNSATFWKVRPMPISAIRCGGRLRMLSPSIRMSPELG